MKKNTLTLVAFSILAVIGSVGWIVAKAAPEIHVQHGANSPVNRARPTVDPTKGIVTMLSQRLDLKPDQKKQIEQIIESSQPAMNAVQADKSLSKETKQQKMGQAMSEMIPKVEATLEPEQKAKFQELLAEMHGAHGAPMNHQ